ncbi:hypothetical protein L1987_53562 [Smallanthus sonchifolius]|uniref:Uncharacterized protein n=1 Tax=Smallanthus sonchifolius TaxID=185202 RepID=A0ACB9EW99_9ASTR|nr:hypothetical protein L1987_53562 [Smallanthus sonchifolius]
MQLFYPFVESALPLVYGVLGVQLFHEVGHFLAAFPKKVKLSIPFFIPNITLGSFGAITQFKSILPDIKMKVDISLAGPFAGAALSLSMFVVGLLLSSKPDAVADMVLVTPCQLRDTVPFRVRAKRGLLLILEVLPKGYGGLELVTE